MRDVSLLPSYAMIYDTTVVTDLIITVYFPSVEKKGTVSDFSLVSFLLFRFINVFLFFFFNSSPPSSIVCFLCFHLPTLPSYSFHKYPFKFTNTIKKCPPPTHTPPHNYLLHYALASIWCEGESLDTANVL